MRSGAAAWACGTGAGGGVGKAAAGPPVFWAFGAADRAAEGGRGCEALGARVFCLACELGRLVDPLPEDVAKKCVWRRVVRGRRFFSADVDAVGRL